MSQRGWVEFNGGDFAFELEEALVPEQWNKICIRIDGINGTFDVFLNSLNVKHQTSAILRGTKELNGTILIGSSTDSKFYGDLTDFNIWSKLSIENIKEYNECNNITNSEYIVKWNEIELKDNSVFLLENHKLCTHKATAYNYRFKTKRSFDKGFKLCDRIGGFPFQAWKENETIYDKNLMNSCPWFWVPIRYKDDKLVNRAQTSEAILTSEIKWSFGSPDDIRNRPCLYIDNSLNAAVSNTKCDSEACHICKLVTPANFKLDGLCENSVIDNEFYLHYDSLTKDLNWRGFGGSAIVMNKRSRQWEIVDVLNMGIVLGRTLLETPEPENYPLGVNVWEILNDTCIGPNQTLSLNLKLSRCNEVLNCNVAMLLR